LNETEKTNAKTAFVFYYIFLPVIFIVVNLKKHLNSGEFSPYSSAIY